MLTKYLILAAVIYGIYRLSIANKISSTPIDQEKEGDEYTDYEEVE